MESAAFEAWPALQQEVLHGWRLRFAQGYTKRANSANALPGAADLDLVQLHQIEARFAAQGLPSIFRLAAFATPAGVDGLLAARGYRLQDPSRVMTLDLGQALPAAAVQGWAPDAATWLSAFQTLAGQLGPDQARHLRLLQAIQAPCAFGLSWQDGVPVACGLAVLVRGRLGLFDIATGPAQRGRGLARALCGRLLAWGQGRGAHSAYLQVTAANAAAIRLYEGLGFGHAYDYAYRVAP
jgi:N-acetylglutamate synthase